MAFAVTHPFCRIQYWKRNGDGFLSASSHDEDWDECVVSPVSTYSSYGEQRFQRADNPDYKIGALLHLLEQAYDLGKRAKLAEIQQLLGIHT